MDQLKAHKKAFETGILVLFADLLLLWGYSITEGKPLPDMEVGVISIILGIFIFIHFSISREVERIEREQNQKNRSAERRDS